MTDSLGTTVYQYDLADQLISKTDPLGFTISFEYDEAGNMTTLIYPDGKRVSYTYDQLNRLETVTIEWLSLTAVYNYDDAGRLISLNQFNGSNSNYGYDKANRLTDIENKYTDESNIASYHFTLDDNGNIIHVNKEKPLNDMVNTETVNYQYNAQKNRLLLAGDSNLDYDAEGQLTSVDTNTFSFDNAHRLIAASGSDMIQYDYDGVGNRLQRITNAIPTRYIYDASGNLLVEADNNNTILRYYVHGLGLMAMVTPANETYCYHYDAIGNTVAMTDQAQSIVNTYSYSPFGIVTNENETISQPFKFVGQFGVIAEPNGLYYMRARYYDPHVGRFISEDPIGFESGDVNLYAYVANNPLNTMDPLGLWGYAIDAGGSYGTGDGSSRYTDFGSAGSGFYFGGRDPYSTNKPGGYAEIGAFSYQGYSGRTAGAHLGLGISLTNYKIDASNFFSGKLAYKTTTVLFWSLTRYYESATNYVGWTFSLFGKGIGFSVNEGCTEGWSAALQ